MRVGKKANVLELKKTRSCVVRLEKVSTASPNVSPSPDRNSNSGRCNRLNRDVMGLTPKTRRAGMPSQQDDKAIIGTAKKKINAHASIHSSFQASLLQNAANVSISNVKLNQKVKLISKSNKPSPSSTPSGEESPPPTIAAGRSRRAIKPNPKYASEDVVTPRVVRNVGMAASSAGRGVAIAQSRTRKSSTSSDDFYNRNSEDEYDKYVDNNMENDDDENDESHNDKAYQVSEKDDQDSDFSVIEDHSVRSARSRSRPKKGAETAKTVQQNDRKLQTQTSNIGRMSVAVNSSNLRSAPSQLQQIRRSLASANAQRNINVLTSSGQTAQKRKVEEILDSSDESGYSIKRRQLLLSNAVFRAKLPVKENKNYATTSMASIRSGLVPQAQVHRSQQHQPLNGNGKINNILTTSRRPVATITKSNSEVIAKSSLRQAAVPVNIQNYKTHNQTPISHAKIFTSKPPRHRSDSPKITLQKPNNGSAISISSSSSNSTSSLNIKSKSSDKTKLLSTQSTSKPKSATTSSEDSSAIHSEIVHEIKDDSPNSTIDDFETMPTFTIVNVNDIINKKGDVLITQSKSTSNTPTVIEFSESISLDDDDDDNNNINDNFEDVEPVPSTYTRTKQILPKKLPKLPALTSRKEIEKKKSPLTRSNDTSTIWSAQPQTSLSSSNQAPQILNHKLGLRNSRVTSKTTTTLTATLTSADKPAPRILNSVVAKRTQPVKPLIANMDDSADESFPLSLDEDEDEMEMETEENGNANAKVVHMTERARKRNCQNIVEVDIEDSESQNTEEDGTALLTPIATSINFPPSSVTALAPKQNTSASLRRRPATATSNNPIIVSNNKKRLTPAATKENSLAATNQQVSDTTKSISTRKPNTEKVVISKQGDKIIKKITCFETWYVINMPVEPKRQAAMKNQLEMPLIRLANHAKNICLPNNLWSSKVTLYELSPQTLIKGTFATYTGDLYEHNIREEDRGKYQPSCVMFRRSIGKNQVSRMPYDRAVIFKNKTFYTNIEGKNVRLVGAPSVINTESEIEILLHVVDILTLQSEFVEHISIVQ